MLEALDSSQEAKRELWQEVASFRKQSVFALILAVLFLLITVYLYYELKQSKTALKASNAALEKTNARLKSSEKQLEEQNAKILALNTALDPFREQYVKENTRKLPRAYARVPELNSKKGILKTDSGKPLMGYIIYMQDRQGGKDSEVLRQALKEKGAIVPAIEHMGDRLKFASSVRYFHQEDKATADLVQKLLLTTLGLKQKSDLQVPMPVQYTGSKKVPLGQLEVWLDT